MTAGRPALRATQPAAAAASSRRASSRIAGADVSTREAYATTGRAPEATRLEWRRDSDGPLAKAAPGEGKDAYGHREVAHDGRDHGSGGERRGAGRVAQDHRARQEVPVALTPQAPMDDPVQHRLEEIGGRAVGRQGEDEHAQHDRAELDLLRDG